MKIKRFNNLWAMGLMLMGAILVAFYVLKIFFPDLIIELAETERLVEFGTFIQSNKWYLHIFNVVTGYVHGYILYCACIRKPYLSWKGNVVLVSQLILLSLINEFYATQYSTLNVAFMCIAPFFICLWEKNITKDTFISTIACFGLELGFEFFSLVVRNLLVMTTYPNVVSFLVLMIDLVIWRVMLYLFFNTKNKKGV